MSKQKEIEEKLSKEPKFAQFFLIKNWFKRFAEDREESKGFFKGMFEDVKNVFSNETRTAGKNIVKEVEQVSSNLIDIETAIGETLKSIDSKNNDEVVKALSKLRDELKSKELNVNVEAPIIQVPEPKIEIVKETKEAAEANQILSKIARLISKQDSVTVDNDSPIPVSVANFPPQAIGGSGGVNHIDRIPYLQIARNKVPGHSIKAIDAITAEINNDSCDIWSFCDREQFYEFSTNLPINRISSSSLLDDQFVLIEGLDFATWLPIQVPVKLNGQTPVVIPDMIRHNSSVNISGLTIPGLPTTSAQDFNGEIFVYEDTTTTGGIPDILTKVRGHIPLGFNINQQAIYSVPKGKTAYVKRLYLTVGRDGSSLGRIRIKIRNFGGVFISSSPFSVPSLNIPTLLPSLFAFPLNEMADIVITVEISGIKTTASALLEFILVDNGI